MSRKSTFSRDGDQLVSNATGESRKSNAFVLVISLIGLIVSTILLTLDYQWAFGLLLLFGMGVVLSCVFWARGRRR